MFRCQSARIVRKAARRFGIARFTLGITFNVAGGSVPPLRLGRGFYGAMALARRVIAFAGM